MASITDKINEIIKSIEDDVGNFKDIQIKLNKKSMDKLEEILPENDSLIDVRRVPKVFIVHPLTSKVTIAKNISFDTLLMSIQRMLNRSETIEPSRRGDYRSGKNLALALRLLLAPTENKNKIVEHLDSVGSAEEINLEVAGFSLNALKNLYDLHKSKRHQSNLKVLLYALKEFNVIESLLTDD